MTRETAAYTGRAPPYDKVFVHYLVVQGCQDEDVMATVRDRQDTHEAVMSALKARIKRVKESAK